MEETQGGLWRMCHTTPRDRRNERRFQLWTLTWMASWLLSHALLKSGAVDGAPAMAAVLLPAGLGIRVAFVYRHFLREADELLRKIQLEALALAVGAGLVGGFTYLSGGLAGAPEF